MAAILFFFEWEKEEGGKIKKRENFVHLVPAGNKTANGYKITPIPSEKSASAATGFSGPHVDLGSMFHFTRAFAYFYLRKEL